MAVQFIADFDPIAGFTFRDSRPFQAGENSVARAAIFPPHPGPFWSAARRALHPRKGRDFGIVARGFALMEDSTSYWPAPLDLVQEDAEAARRRSDQPNASFVILAPRRHSQAAVTLDTRGLRLLWAPTRLPTRSLEGQLLIPDLWRSYLFGSPGLAGRDSVRSA